ncbi:hypothetical protein EKI60_06560 [Candidatus Saccharibacteria bacterium]|nr:MAG: hypothetical protein EKI60_06560 [Candidatus Saccharibacteria bacterium]
MSNDRKKVKYEFVCRFDTGTGLALTKKVKSTTPIGASKIILRKHPEACDIEVTFDRKQLTKEQQ